MLRAPLPRLARHAPAARTLPVLLLVSLLAACSMAEFGYGQAPALFAFRIERAFDLSDRQQTGLRLRLDDFHAWHRDTELARYETVLTAAAARAEDGVDEAEIVWLVDEVRAARDRFIDRLIDDLAPLASQLEPRQIEHFRRYRAKDLAEDLEERRRPDWAEKLAERRLERIEDWTGSLDAEVERRVRERLAQIPDRFESWGRYRAQRDEMLADALAGSASAEALKARLRLVLLDPEAEFRRAFEADRQAYWKQYSAAIVDILGWLPEDRRRHVIEQLRDYARIARSLRT